MSSFADLIANDESADESYASESSDNIEDEDKLNATEAVVLSANPPGTAPGCLLISRDVWEVVRLSDSIIREDCHVQIEKLVEAIDALLANNTPLPDDMHTVHRLLLTANRFWRTSKAANEASEEQNGLWYRYHMFKSYESAISLLQSTLRPVAATWHSARRAAILQKHGAEVTKLMRDDPLTPACMLLMVYAHIWVALHLEDLQEFVLGDGSSSSSLGLGFSSAFVAAALFGGFCAFGFQALDHELSHCASLVPPWVGGDKYSSKVNTAFCHGLGVLGSACTAVPWFSYYFSGGHARHHKFAGTPQDIDREAFFWAWERTPKGIPDTPLGSVVWASVVGLGLPVMYVVSLLVCLLGNWRSNVKELCYFAVDSLATTLLHLVVLWGGGWRGLLYLVLSMGFGNGFLMHPLIGFWLMQHLCQATESNTPEAPSSSSVKGRDFSRAGTSGYISMQPTVSYDGSALWNLLNFNQLSHVEHHDFSRIPWTKAPQLRRTAPEFYGVSGKNGLRSITSVWSLMSHWVFTKGDKMNFACILAKAPLSTSKAEKDKGA